VTGKRFGHPKRSGVGTPVVFAGDVHPESAERLSSNSPDLGRCRFAFADGRRCALPASPHSDGLCYTHAHATRRRLRPSDLIRELESISSSPIDNAHVHRLLAKLPAAADGVLSPKDASIIRQNCALMLQCATLSKGEPLPEPRGSEWNLVVSILNSDGDDENENHDDELSRFPENR
jgi:hypothetical protein